jgi:hypothetical protein
MVTRISLKSVNILISPFECEKGSFYGTPERVRPGSRAAPLAAAAFGKLSQAELLRIPLPRTPVNKGKRKGRSPEREDARGFPGWHHGGRRKGSVLDHRGDNMMRWYNPALEGFEWREVPESDEEALSALEGSPFTPSCTQTYREWRDLGVGIMAALIRAGEAAQTPSKNF